VCVLRVAATGGMSLVGASTLDCCRARVHRAAVFSLGAITSLALPLFVVTMASQNLPGVAAIRAAGYDMPGHSNPDSSP
jgi:benzoate membrane transport protein